MKRFLPVILMLTMVIATSLSQTTWRMDKPHTTIDFSVRYMMLSNVTGTYSEYDGTLIQGNADFSDSKLDVTISSATINTRSNDRDNHLRSADFFDVENFPNITFVSNGFRKIDNNIYKISGTLTIRDVSKPVELDGELLGMATDPQGRERVAFAAVTTVNRSDFGVEWNRALEAGGWLVGETVSININTQFIKAQ